MIVPILIVVLFVFTTIAIIWLLKKAKKYVEKTDVEATYLEKMAEQERYVASLTKKEEKK